jgi:hypothetical protein
LVLGDLGLVVKFGSLFLFEDVLINEKAHALVVWPWKYQKYSTAKKYIKNTNAKLLIKHLKC